VSLYIQSEKPALDALLSFAGGDSTFVESLMMSWTRQSEELLRDSIAAVYWFDVPAFVHAVHTLGGSSGTIGLSGLADVCAHTERSLRSGSTRPLGEYLAWIIAAYRVARTEASLILTDLSLTHRSRMET
jgi:HPt (histidine-containing phosphotransfer) domain-containing protein